MKEFLSSLKFDIIGSYGNLPGTTPEEFALRQAAEGLHTVTGTYFDLFEREIDFFAAFGGLERVVIESGRVYQPYPSMTDLLRMTGPVSFDPAHHALGVYSNLRRVCPAGSLVKRTIPAPARLLAVLLQDDSRRAFYGSDEELADSIGAAYNALLREMYGLGCRFVQLNDSSWATLTDPRGVKELLLGGVDVAAYIDLLIRANNKALENLPADMISALYVCRGGTDPSLRPVGDYGLVAAKLFGESKVDAFYLDFNTDSDNDFSVLEHIPVGRKVMLGLLSPFGPLADTTAFVRANVEAASKHYPRHELGVTFRCPMRADVEASTGEPTQWQRIAMLKKSASSSYE
ncbi:MAG: hypothetical protein NC418_11005 [Muribaculaceae bacterium]|nr:hypothetical protein [Muribaculaceae bacterium]